MRTLFRKVFDWSQISYYNLHIYIFTIHFLFPSFRHDVFCGWFFRQRTPKKKRLLLLSGGERPRKQRWDRRYVVEPKWYGFSNLGETPNLEGFWLGHLMSFIIFGIVFLMDDFGLIRISCFEIPRQGPLGQWTQSTLSAPRSGVQFGRRMKVPLRLGVYGGGHEEFSGLVFFTFNWGSFMFILHDFCLCQLLNMLFRIVEKSTCFKFFVLPEAIRVRKKTCQSYPSVGTAPCSRFILSGAIFQRLIR